MRRAETQAEIECIVRGSFALGRYKMAPSCGLFVPGFPAPCDWSVADGDPFDPLLQEWIPGQNHRPWSLERPVRGTCRGSICPTKFLCQLVWRVSRIKGTWGMVSVLNKINGNERERPRIYE